MSKFAECFNCDFKGKFPFKPVKLYRTEIFGLYLVVYNAVLKAECPECRHEYVKFPKSQDATRKLAHALVERKRSLTGKEVRFIRKYLGLSTPVFASRLGYGREQINRIENGKPVMGVLDLAVRQLFRNMGGEPDRNYDKHDRELVRDEEKKKIEIKFGHGRMLAYA